ncbi:MAG: FAD-dependent oxidoreductase [Eubacteriales bacterium]
MQRDIIIIGGGTAGMTAAIYGARAGKSVTIFESTAMGGQIATSPNVENFPGFESISGMEFSDKLFEQATKLGVEVELGEIISVVPGETITIATEDETFTCRALIVATGVNHRHLGTPAEAKFAGKGVGYCAVCDGAFYRGKDVCVVGGGSTALQSALMLSDICATVHLIHRRDEFRGEPVLAERVKTVKNIELHLKATVSDLFGENKLEKVRLSNGEEISAEGLFVCVGQVPSNGFLQGVVDLDEGGFVIAGEDCRTKEPNIFVAGDCRTKNVRQLTTAAADGTTAALAASQL